MAVGTAIGSGYTRQMTAADLKSLLERVQAWPKQAQDELAALIVQIENELRGDDYIATREELEIIDEAIASLDRGEAASDREIEDAFARFRAG
jgi:hypothetical protein